MSIKEIHLKSLDSALLKLQELASSHSDIVFRGHVDSSWTIRSTLSRYTVVPHESWDTHIDEMLSHFLTNLRSIGEYPDAVAGNRRARLEYGRHYGVPSPLIDFSLSPYIALFFAFNGVRPDPAKPEAKVAIYALDVGALGLAWAQKCTTLHSENLGEEMRRFMYENDNVFADGYPGGTLKYIRYPASWNKRMQRQMGVFLYDTLDYKQLGYEDFEGFIDAPKESPDATTGTASPILSKLIIPCSVAAESFSRLELMGINATMLYGDHSGAADDVYNAYNYNRKTGYAWDLRMPLPDDKKLQSEAGRAEAAE